MKKKCTKYITLFLAATLAFGAVGCGKDAPQEDASAQKEASVDADAKKDADKNTDADAKKDTDKNTEKDAEKDAADASPASLLQEAFVMADGAPEVVAESAILIDAETGTILYEKNGAQKMYPASMTKILTSLVALDYFKPEDLVEVGTEINEITLDSSKAGHQLGETLTMENLIRGLIIPSGNDSANVVAAAVARKVEEDENLSFARCETIFTELMNKKAEALGATNSHFSNAHGYHDEAHYTTSRDMALLAKAFMENEVLAEIAGERNFSGNGANQASGEATDLKTQDYAWGSHNLLITNSEYQYGYATGIKTGFTDEAGDCVAASAEKDRQRLIAIIFHSEDPNRWLDAKNLFEYGFNSYQKVELAQAGETIEEAALTKHKPAEGDTLAVVYQEDLTTYLPEAAANTLKTTVTYEEAYTETDKEGNLSLKAPIEKGAQVGTVAFEVNGKTVLETGAYAGREVSKGNIFNQIAAFFSNVFHNLFSLKGLIVVVGLLVGIGVIFGIVRMVGGRHRRRGGYSLGSSSRMGVGGGRRRSHRRRRFK